MEEEGTESGVCSNFKNSQSSTFDDKISNVYVFCLSLIYLISVSVGNDTPIDCEQDYDYFYFY